MKFIVASSLAAGVSAVITETKARNLKRSSTQIQSLIVADLEEMYPNATIMLKKNVNYDEDAWEAYQAKKAQRQIPVDEVSAPVTAKDGAYDMPGHALTPGPLPAWAESMKKQCAKLGPDQNGHNGLAQAQYSNFLTGWGWKAGIQQTYGALIIADEMMNAVVDSCTNVRKQTELYGMAENQCCQTALEACCASHVNYEVAKKQLGYRWMYVCQGVHDFPYGKADMTKEECMSHHEKHE